jgi:RNA polymerase sigma factor (sigma-70 family)
LKRKDTIRLTNEQRTIVEKNHRLIYFFCNQKKLRIEEWYDIFAIALCKCAQSYNYQYHLAFSTYVMIVFKHEMGRQAVHRNRRKRIPESLIDSLDAHIGDADRADEDFSRSSFISDKPTNFNKEIYYSEFDEWVREHLTVRQQEAIKYMRMGYTEKDIATILGISHQAVHDRLQKGFIRIRKNLINDRKLQDILDGLKEICNEESAG